MVVKDFSGAIQEHDLMGSATPVRVRILRIVEEEITIYATTTAEAEREAAEIDGVQGVVASRHQKVEEDDLPVPISSGRR
jgi:hypothetical protein